ncbi:EamA family transporter [archaeon]|jgi:drug/metabolite transporter (DMT)-like permease|nr:EamA family transporter [archaeon]
MFLENIPLIVLCLGSFFGLGIANGILKISTDGRGIFKTLITRDIVSILILLPFFLKVFKETNWEFLPIAIAIGLGIILAVASFNFSTAIRIGNAGVVSAVGNSYVFLTIGLSTLFLKEGLTSLQIGLGLITILGVILLSLKNGKNKSNKVSFHKGVPRALVAMFIWAGMYAIIIYPISKIGIFPTAFLMTSSILTSITVISLIKGFDKPKNTHKFNFSKTSLLLINILIGILVSISLIFLVLAVQRNQVGLMSVFTGANPIIVVVFGLIFYNKVQEKLTLRQWTGLFISITAIIFLSLLK